MKSIWREDVPLTHNPLKFLWFVSRPHRLSMAAAMLTVVTASLLSVGIAYTFKLIVNAATHVSNDISGNAYHNLLLAAGASILLRFVIEVLWRTSGYMGAYWATGSRATARHALTSYVTLHSRNYFSNRFAGSLSSKIKDASSGMRDMIEQILWQFMVFFFTVMGSFTLMFTINHNIAFIFIAWVVVVLVVNALFARTRIALSAETQRLETLLGGATVDLISNITAMQEYVRRSYELVRLRDITEARRTAGLKNWHYGEKILSFNGLMQALFSAGMVFFAIHLMRVGSISVGDIILVVTIIFNIEGQMLFLGSQLNSFGERWGEITESLSEILTPLDMPESDTVSHAVLSGGSIDFDDVNFSYAGANVFEHFTLHIKAGERVGLVGRSGAGKSTLVQLLLRHYDVTNGIIAIDGMDVQKLSKASVRQAIAVVPQESVLFHRSIEDNIRYGKEGATHDEVVEAARRAQAHEFISRVPSGYAALVGERGVKLSGGERQRIAITRAILKDAPILLLDEATSALDSESEVAIQRALHELMQGKTVIAIAHRLSTLREMDRIVVLEKGVIAEEGTHEELVARGGIYAELWNHQAGGFLTEEE